ncbi:conjugal transfer protein TraO [Porphyromonas sp. HMSC065F10]|uniref:conjugal transfer protein TraO n=1 Tax=Porphyromonas sp. HMSC065F10 TaxID=1739394 RepID=UPI0008A4F2F7|nr:conjugal transfer protein TraO [Porphyromonas sp. HMSC065F10]OFR36599.1 conjugal transfer protein [Porphyromonas sp. HMSC065F10]
MKRFLFIGILFALCLHFNQAHAQRYLPGMKGLQVTAGMADGVHRDSDTDFAYHIGAAYSVYTKNANRWIIGGEYLHKKYDYKDMQIPVKQFTAEGGYYLKFLSDRRKTFFLSLGLPALAGYEVSNKSEKLLPDGSTLQDKDCFIYGGALTLELEAYLTDRVALLLNARERSLFGSDIGKFHTQVGIGVKFINN